MRYSYDENKRAKVLEERDLDLSLARHVFDGFYLSREDVKHSDEEPPTITVGMLNEDVVVLVVWTPGLESGASLRCGKPMKRKGSDIMTNAIDPTDNRPVLDDDWFAEADAFRGTALVRRGRPKSDNPKQPVTIRLDRDIVDWFKRSGDGWQTRINTELRKVAGI